MTPSIKIVHGENKKPAASRALMTAFEDVEGLTGTLHFGAPFIQLNLETVALDAVLISPEVGVVIFDLLESTDENVDLGARQDDLFAGLQAHLLPIRGLSRNRRLVPIINVLSFNPHPRSMNFSSMNEGVLIADALELNQALAKLKNDSLTDAGVYRSTLSAIQNLAGIRTHSTKRKTSNPTSKGARLQHLDEQIAVFDDEQAPLITETLNGVQRIRGLAGSGKTIVLAAKAAYLHAQHPDWNIAITFHTRALKGQLTRLIERFVAGYKKTVPDWDRLHILNAWGGSGGADNTGIYRQFCLATNQPSLTYSDAKHRYGPASDYLRLICDEALQKSSAVTPMYDIILVDEAQDLPPSFLRICYEMLTKEKRLVYAYDELQNLSGYSLPEPEEIFGNTAQGIPRVSLKGKPRQDVILNRCYRNPGPVLATAHALGFGIYRTPPPESTTGLVQMFDTPELWTEIGYRVDGGTLAKGCHVILSRDPKASPDFLELTDSPDAPLIEFNVFENEEAQNVWVADQVQENLEADELRHQDIIVISPDRYNSPAKLGPIRAILFERGIQSHTAGIDTDRNEFFQEKFPSVTFTGIYRAKGNEAGMVYIIGAEDFIDVGGRMATSRNRLFTAITRSKAWVRVLGVGEKMERLKAEYERIVDNDYRLAFDYPDADQLKQIHNMYSSGDESQSPLEAAISKLISEGGKGLSQATLDELETLVRKGEL